MHDLQDVARANLIYGLHVHVGLPDREEAIAVFNQARYFLPHLLALSTSSPFFNGRKSGLKSTRTLMFKRLPRTGIPEAFASYGELERFVSTLVKTGCIDDARRIWWDIRPHPKFSTLEFRICDTPTRIDETCAIVALLQAVVRKLTLLYEHNMGYRLYRRALIAENVYRAARYGVEGKLIDFQKAVEVPTARVILELCEFLRDDFEALGTLRYIEVIREIIERGNSARRQLDCFARSTDGPRAVTRQIIEETREGVID